MPSLQQLKDILIYFSRDRSADLSASLKFDRTGLQQINLKLVEG